MRSGAMKNSIACKSGSDWTEEDLDFFRIRIEQIAGFEDFFGTDMPQLVLGSDVRGFLNCDLSDIIVQQRIDLSHISSRIAKTVIKDLIAVTKTHRFEESAVDDLSKSLFQLFEYDWGDRSIRTREILELDMSNRKTQAIPDICIETLDLSIKLVVQEDKSYNVGNDRHLMGHHPQAQLIAETVAAFQENVRIFKKLGRTDIPSRHTIPGIVMLGTCPTFYVTEITQDLSECIRRGQRPNFDTVVRKYMVPDLPINLADVMLSRSHARHIALCYEAFKRMF